MAADSTSTTLDHSTWYVDTSPYGITCAVGMLRPLRYTFGLMPSVSISTLRPASSKRSRSACNLLVCGRS